MEARRVTCLLAHGLASLGLVFAMAITPALAQTGDHRSDGTGDRLHWCGPSRYVGHRP